MTQYTYKDIARLEEENAFLRVTQEQITRVYPERDQCIALLAAFAYDHGYKVGIGTHESQGDWDKEWLNVVFIDLPTTGQVSWHIHESELPWFEGIGTYEEKWDGHDTPEKYRRVVQFAHDLIAHPLQKVELDEEDEHYEKMLKAMKHWDTESDDRA